MDKLNLQAGKIDIHHIVEENMQLLSSVQGKDIKLVNDDGVEVAAGEAGEMWVKGPQVMKGYYNRPDETLKVLNADGWLATGDIARVDDDGFFYIVDRKKDMILVSGFNVYPNEIEEEIAKLSNVKEVGVIAEEIGGPKAVVG